MAGRRRVWILGGLGLVVIVGVGAALAGRFLVVDAPLPADVIVVLAGETDRRPARALELLQQGYARRVVLDVSADDRVFDFTVLQLAQKHVQSLPQAADISVCPIEGLSTKAETQDVERCLREDPVLSASPSARVLIVTSDFHTRRALSIFRREVRGRTFSVAASHDDAQFGTRWWTRRQWAKTLLDEWMKLCWWNVVDRWH